MCTLNKSFLYLIGKNVLGSVIDACQIPYMLPLMPCLKENERISLAENNSHVANIWRKTKFIK